MEEKIYALPPSEHWRAALQLLANGDYELGFRLYETRTIEMGGRPAGRPKLSIPEWNGDAVKSLLILPEQGYGDQIMFARYAPHLRKLGVEVTIMCHPRLARLFGSLGVRVLSAQGRVELPQVNAWVLGPSLPYRCGTRIDTIPSEPYISAPPRKLDAKIGLMLKGNAAYANDGMRSLGENEISILKSIPGSIDLSPESTGARDFRETAEIIAGLSTVVSVDTAVAHLAGAMGKRCLLLVPFHADWRWLRNRSDSPWYPSIRIFRQQDAGDWSSALNSVRNALEASD